MRIKWYSFVYASSAEVKITGSLQVKNTNFKNYEDVL